VTRLHSYSRKSQSSSASILSWQIKIFESRRANLFSVLVRHRDKNADIMRRAGGARARRRGMPVALYKPAMRKLTPLQHQNNSAVFISDLSASMSKVRGSVLSAFFFRRFCAVLRIRCSRRGEWARRGNKMGTWSMHYEAVCTGEG
jgi:hypothetical protein